MGWLDKKECVEDYQCVNINDILQSNKKLNGLEKYQKSNNIQEKEVIMDSFILNLTTTPCHFGGVRPWFICEKCKKKVGTLFFKETSQDAYCRKCLNLTYKARQEKVKIHFKLARIKKQIDKVKEKLNKKGLHLRTINNLFNEYDRLKKEYINELNLINSYFSNKLNCKRNSS